LGEHRDPAGIPRRAQPLERGGPTGGQPGAAPATAIERQVARQDVDRFATMLREDPNAYWRSPELQQQHRDAIMRAEGGAPPALPWLEASAMALQTLAKRSAMIRQDWRNHRPLRSASFAACHAPIFREADLQPLRNQTQDALVRDTVLEKTDCPRVGFPCERFTAALASRTSCITRGRGGWLDLPRGGLAPPILCQLPGALADGSRAVLAAKCRRVRSTPESRRHGGAAVDSGLGYQKTFLYSANGDPYFRKNCVTNDPSVESRLRA
jgi:hypothetical protein